LAIQPGSLGGGLLIANSIDATKIVANTITADKIATGTITGNLFSANVVLVNQVIASNNYSSGVSGWAIFGNGNAEFANTSIRGTLTAVELQIDENNFWEDDGFVLGGNTGIYTYNGNVVIGTNVVIEGTITADQIAIDNNNFWNDGGFALGGTAGIYTSNGLVRIGTSVVIEGDIVADSVFTDGLDIYANGALVANNFSVSAAGVMSATGANISGTVSSGNLTATGGTIGGYSISSDSLSSATFIMYAANGRVFMNGPAGSVDFNAADGTGFTMRTNSPGREARIGPSIIVVTDGGNASSITSTQINNLDGELNIGKIFNFNAASVPINLSTNLRRRDADGRLMIEASRRDLKANISSIDNSLQIIKALNPVSFHWKDESQYDTILNKDLRNKMKQMKEYGFIAEEVQEVDPWLCSYDTSIDDPSLTPRMWQQNALIALCVSSIKEIAARLEVLEQQLGYNS